MEPARIVKIKLLRRYSTYGPGAVLDCDDDIARSLVSSGHAEDLDPTVVETAAIDPACETSEYTPRKVTRHAGLPKHPPTDAAAR